jgi:hypothetical protein
MTSPITIETSDKLAKMLIALSVIAHYPLNTPDDYRRLKDAIADYETYMIRVSEYSRHNLTSLHISRLFDRLSDFIAHPTHTHYVGLSKTILEYFEHWNWEISNEP